MIDLDKDCINITDSFNKFTSAIYDINGRILWRVGGEATSMVICRAKTSSIGSQGAGMNVIDTSKDTSTLLQVIVDGIVYNSSTFLGMLVHGQWEITQMEEQTDSIEFIFILKGNGIPEALFSSTQWEYCEVNTENIGISCFEFASLKTLVLGPSVANLEDSCFGGNDNLYKIVFQGAAPIVGSRVFQGCGNNISPYLRRVYAQRSILSAILAIAPTGYFVKPLLKKHPFSVSSNKTVSFGTGNLIYIGEDGVRTGGFGFAVNQYDYVGNTMGNTTKPTLRKTQSNPIDLFSWACSGGQFDGYHYHYKPYDCIYYNSASSYAFYYGIVYGSNNYSYSLADTGGDWGVANTFPSELEESGWRTPTDAEWLFVHSSRTDAAKLRAKGKVNGINGLFLLPDDWVLPTGVSIVTDSSATTNFNSNSFTIDQWEALEDAGAIFLPACGYRSGVTANSGQTDADSYTGTGAPSVGDVNTVGSYWSTTNTGSQAYRFYFQTSTTTPRSSTARYTGYAVRLIRDGE